MSVGLNVIETTWLLLGILFFLAVSIHTISLYLPYECEKFQAFILFQDLIRYGKTKKSKRDTWLRVFDIPKRWFWHFYAVSVLWNGLLVVVSLRAIQWDEPYPPWLTDTLSFLAGSSATHGQAPHVCSVAVQVLVWIHCLRRLAECLYVSVFSDGVIHVVQYVFGLGYYILLGLTVLCWDRNTEGKGGWSAAVRLGLPAPAPLPDHSSSPADWGFRCSGDSGPPGSQRGMVRAGLLPPLPGRAAYLCVSEPGVWRCFSHLVAGRSLRPLQPDAGCPAVSSVLQEQV
ncbi:polyprenol reductase isoform X4 [Hypomesus transpacificus]|uniref:polyprenol reductase isoform X4 n=1 Tax=Hypomesus transpacificus TaxID=137520 RepID=UPI001F0739FA|nr:polyprenol reductase isoform X4 [Hypomesus transpacificus]